MGGPDETPAPFPLRYKRRGVLQAALALGLGVSCSREATAQDVDPRRARPQEGDRFVFPAGERQGAVVTPAELPVGGPPLTVYPMDPGTGVVRDGSRLNQVILASWGTGNAAPWPGDMHPGDNLYATSVIALDVDSGQIKAHHQYHWNDSWDWDEVSAPLLIDVQRNGRTIKGLVHPARNGYLWLLDRTADAISFVNAKPYVIQEVFTGLDPKTGRPSYDMEKKPATGKMVNFCPSLWGGKDWTPAAYNPQTRYLYIPANENLCSTLVGKQAPYETGKLYLGVDRAAIKMNMREGAQHIGELQAWDLQKMEKVWTHTFNGLLTRFEDFVSNYLILLRIKMDIDA